MYHRILPVECVTSNIEDGMYVTPESFEMQIRFLKKHFNILHVSKINDGDRDEIISDADKPVCFLTFDDGWYDFYEYAFPILSKYNVPAMVFLTTGYINTNNWFWTDRLAAILNEPNDHKLSANISAILSDANPAAAIVTKILNLTKRSGSILDEAIKILKKQKPVIIEDVLDKLSKIFPTNPTLKGRSFLYWDEIKKMHSSNLVEFGSHTHMHKLLDKIDEKELIYELQESKNILLNRSLVNEHTLFFCYPNGNYNADVIEKVQDTGYQLGFTTKHSWQGEDFKPFELRRIAIHNDVTFSKTLFASRISGLF